MSKKVQNPAQYLTNVFRQMKNPLDNEETLFRFAEFANNPGDNIFAKESTLFYKKVQTESIDKKFNYIDINHEDENRLFITLFNEFKQNFLNTFGNNIDGFNTNTENGKKIIKETLEFLRSLPPMHSKQELLNAIRNNIFGDTFNFISRGFNNNEWQQIYNTYFNNTSFPKIEHRLYLNTEIPYIHKFALLFYQKCKERNIEYNFKFSTNQNRSDQFVIYSSTENLADYIDIIREILIEHKEIANNTYTPPPLAGIIDDKIGYGAHPEDDSKSSYSKKRAYMLYYALKNLQNKWILNNITNGEAMIPIPEEEPALPILIVGDFIRYYINKELENNGAEGRFSGYTFDSADFVNEHIKDFLMAIFKNDDLTNEDIKYSNEEIEEMYPNIDKEKLLKDFQKSWGTEFGDPTTYCTSSIFNGVERGIDFIAEHFLENPDNVLSYMNDQFPHDAREGVKKLSKKFDIDPNTFYFDTTTQKTLEDFGVSFNNSDLSDTRKWAEVRKMIHRMRMSYSTLSDEEKRFLSYLEEQEKQHNEEEEKIQHSQELEYAENNQLPKKQLRRTLLDYARSTSNTPRKKSPGLLAAHINLDEQHNKEHCREGYNHGGHKRGRGGHSR